MTYRRNFKERLEDFDAEILIIKQFLKKPDDLLDLSDIIKGLDGYKSDTLRKKVGGLVQSKILIIKLKNPLQLELNPEVKSKISPFSKNFKELLDILETIEARENLIKKDRREKMSK